MHYSLLNIAYIYITKHRIRLIFSQKCNICTTFKYKEYRRKEKKIKVDSLLTLLSIQNHICTCTLIIRHNYAIMCIWYHCRYFAMLKNSLKNYQLIGITQHQHGHIKYYFLKKNYFVLVFFFNSKNNKGRRLRKID